MNNQELVKTIIEIPAENQVTEFKRLNGKGNVAKIIETIVAMANAEGGFIIIGVDDPEKSKLKGYKRIFGIEENLEMFDEIEKEAQRIVPPLSNIIPISKIKDDVSGNTIGLIQVSKATDNFRSINGKVYVRQEKSNKLLTPQEVIKYAYIKGFEKADKELVDVDFDLLKTSIYQSWKSKRNVQGDDIKEVLFKTGLARKDGRKIKPTRAAVLLFAEYPNDLLDTKCSIRVFQYEGSVETFQETPNLIGTPKSINGALVNQIKEAHEYVLTLLRSGIKIPSGFTTKYKIPERAAKEGITNAVIHRDYYLKRDITVRIFENRVEIESPGLFPYNITPFNIGYERSEGYRNDLLVKHLREFPDPPNLDQNEGIKAMRNEMYSEDLYPPVFITYPFLQDSVRLVLRNESRPSEWEKISHYLESNKYINNKIAREVTGVVQRDKMTKLLKSWVDNGLLVQIVPESGYVRGTKYRLPVTKEINV